MIVIDPTRSMAVKWASSLRTAAPARAAVAAIQMSLTGSFRPVCARCDRISAHTSATPKIVVKGDKADAVGYSFVIKREGDRWFVWRAA